MSNTPPPNIDAFNRVVAETLVTLYDEFPNPMELDGQKIGERVVRKLNAGDDEQTFKIIASIAPETIEFLVSEGFLSFRKDMRNMDGAGKFPQARLTLRGLTLLGQVPEGVSPKGDSPTLAQRLRQAMSQGATQAISTAVGNLLILAGTKAFDAA